MRTILIAGNHSIFKDALVSFIENNGYMIIGKEQNGIKALQIIEEESPDVLITDVSMPNINGFDLIKKAKKIDLGIKVLVFSKHITDNIVTKSLESGASAYLSKETTPNELVTALDTIFENGTYLSKDVSEVLVEAQVRSIRGKKKACLSTLSKREIEVIKCVAKGLTSIEIGSLLFISARTVDTHRNNILKKLNVRNSAELVSLAYENHIIEIESAKA